MPRRCCLDLSGLVQGESPCEDLAPSKLWNSLAWYERLAVWLLAEKEQGAASVVSGYISYLPQPGCASFYDAPLHWDDEELRELQYPPIISAVYECAGPPLVGTRTPVASRSSCSSSRPFPHNARARASRGDRQREQIRQLHQRLRAGGGSAAARVSLADLTWAEQVVWSRAFASTVQRADAPPPPPPPQMEKKVLFEAEWLGKVGCRHPLWSPDHLPDCHSARHDGRWRVLAMHLGGLPSHPARAVRVLPLGGASSALRRTPRGHLRLWRADQGDDPGRRDAHARQRGGGDAADGDGADADARLAQPRLLGLGLVLLRPRRGRLRPLDLAPSQGGRAGAPLLWRQGQRRAAPGATARPRTNSRRRPRPF